MKNVMIDQKAYTLEKNYKDAFVLEEVENLFTDYFYDFDYVFGDYSYGKLRLKGFREPKNSKTTKINNIENLEEYIQKYCSYDCKYFLLKKAK